MMKIWIIWLLVLVVGLVAALTFPNIDHALLDGNNAALTKQAVMRLGRGDLGLRLQEFCAFLTYSGWLLVKPLYIFGGFFVLELYFSPREIKRSNILLAWAVQTAFLASLTACYSVAHLFHIDPKPLFFIKSDGSILSYLDELFTFVLILAVSDFLEYWAHRAQHRIIILWRYHAVHHSMEIDALHNIRHPFDLVPVSLLVTVSISSVLGVSSGQLVLIVALASLQTHLNHTRLPIHWGQFRKILCDNRYHFVHHSLAPEDYNRNFAGRFPIFDVIFGTYKAPPEHLLETGLADRGQPETLKQYILARLPERR